MGGDDTGNATWEIVRGRECKKMFLGGTVKTYSPIKNVLAFIVLSHLTLYGVCNIREHTYVLQVPWIAA